MIFDGSRGRIIDTRPVIVVAAWAVSVVVGVGAMVKYQSTPGKVGVAPHLIACMKSPKKGQLLVFLHPQCECSIATVDELQRMMTHAHGALATSIYFYKPSSAPDSWCTATRLWNAANLIPGAMLRIDTDGKSAKAYGARCSGQVLLYSLPSGKLIFSGGLTESRGHEGGSIGEDAVMTFARSGVCPVDKTAVFGCLIW